MDMNYRKKKAIIAGGVAAILLLFSLISNQFRKPVSVAEATETTSSEAETEVIPSTEIEITVAAVIAESSETEKETETLLPQSDQVVQEIQTEATKPAEPPREKITNPNQKPNGETVAKPEPVKHEEVVVPTEAPRVEEIPETKTAESAPSSETQGGETEAGGIYVPGFGWVEGAGDSYGVTAEDIYENGNKIGIMN
ncbi:DUF6550 family protein [Lacrimispora sp.]|uniref:DUF6550 family protein n=1 Tax=Lacrimispora sp. TaxID=2719234 RepID=UPI0028AED8BB|nr:DUF6550 family protein [Lacrimispora sp.]